jgi:hypothetical protein
MTTSSSTNHDRVDDTRRASPVGAYITTVGAVIFLVSVWLDWITLGPGDSESVARSGYEADSLIPFMGYLAIGLSLALLYATVRADRRQHRGLSLASMAAGLASLLWVASFLYDPISTTQWRQNVSTELGPYIALVGALLWTVGSFLLAKEPEGDHESTRVTQATAVTHTRPAQTARVEHRDVHTTGTSTGTSTGTGARTYDTTDSYDAQGATTRRDQGFNNPR